MQSFDLLSTPAVRIHQSNVVKESYFDSFASGLVCCKNATKVLRLVTVIGPAGSLASLETNVASVFRCTAVPG